MKFESDNIVMLILRKLVYYDIFNYPLKEKDIINNIPLSSSTKESILGHLKSLMDKGVVFQFGDYYSLKNDPDSVNLRVAENSRVEKWLKKARWFSGIISGFPYVRGVSVSGSLSKGMVGHDPDIDYFIITQPGRLWLARTFLIIFKKIFLLNSYKYFCLNYFIDTDKLEIEEKNLFTATELTTLIPFYGSDISKSFFEHNEWVKAYYPNFRLDKFPEVNDRPKLYVKPFLENLFNGRAGDSLDRFFMQITKRHWLRKFKDHPNHKDFELMFKSTRSISKHHPGNFQNMVQREYKKRIRNLEKKFEINLEKAYFQL